MLVLSRQRDETIMIGDDIEITIVDIRGDKVRLGINAPSKVAVHRKEVYESIRTENQRASLIAGAELTLSPPATAVRPRIAAARLPAFAGPHAGPIPIRPPILTARTASPPLPPAARA
ncbi:hypothetical protein BH11PLA1_BH11PLA1_17280 [soil metagenome]